MKHYAPPNEKNIVKLKGEHSPCTVEGIFCQHPPGTDSFQLHSPWRCPIFSRDIFVYLSHWRKWIGPWLFCLLMPGFVILRHAILFSYGSQFIPSIVWTIPLPWLSNFYYCSHFLYKLYKNEWEGMLEFGPWSASLNAQFFIVSGLFLFWNEYRGKIRNDPSLCIPYSTPCLLAFQDLGKPTGSSLGTVGVVSWKSLLSGSVTVGNSLVTKFPFFLFIFFLRVYSPSLILSACIFPCLDILSKLRFFFLGNMLRRGLNSSKRIYQRYLFQNSWNINDLWSRLIFLECWF